MRLTRREFVQGTVAAVSATALGVGPVFGKEGVAMTPAINPVYLTGSMENWPLGELAAMGYRGLELPPECLDRTSSWLPAAKKAGLRPLCINALPDLCPYLTGSLSDAVPYRRRSTLDRLLQTLELMRKEDIPFLVVAPSRLAENYQSPAEARSLLLESLRELAGAGDTTILLEAAPFRLFASSQEIAGVVDEIALPNLAAALDVGHALLVGENPSPAATTLGARLKYVQVHDADARPGIPLLDRHLPLGLGSLSKEEVKSAVGDLPFAMSITAPNDPIPAARAALEWLVHK